MKFVLLLSFLLAFSESAPVNPDISACFSAKNASATNRILICNPDDVLSDDNVDKLKLYELALPENSVCQLKILLYVKNVTREPSLPDISDFKCPSSNCCDTIFVFYSAANREISVSASLPGKGIQECRIQDLAKKSNLVATSNETSDDSEAYNRLAVFLNKLSTEFQNPEAVCINYEIPTNKSQEVSALPLIITIILAIVILLVILVLIGILVSVYLSRRSNASGKPGFLFRNGRGEGQETEALETAIPSSKTEEEEPEGNQKKEAEPHAVADGPAESAPDDAEKGKSDE